MHPYFTPFEVLIEFERCPALLCLSLKKMLAYRAQVMYRSLQFIDIVSNFSHNFVLERESKPVFRSIKAP